MSNVFSAIRSFANFQQENFWALYKKIFKTNLYALVILGVAIVLGVLVIEIEKSGAALILIYFIGLLSASSMWFSNLLLLKDPQSKISKIEFTKENGPNIAAFGLLSLVLVFGIMLIGAFFGPLLIFAVVVLAALVVLFLQFAPFELIYNRKTAYATFLSSFDLVKKNIKETIGFSFSKAIADCGFLFLLLILFLLQQSVLVVLSSFLSADAFTIVALIVSLFVFVPLWNAIMSLHFLVISSFMYEYWKLIGKTENILQPEVTKKRSGKR